ncbi:nSTAND1 domain-containing NTPase, partial [Methylomonas fluvii]
MQINRSLAIIIGIDNYEHIPKLTNAVADAQEMAKVLKELYHYEVLLLLNEKANKEKFDELLANLQKQIIVFNDKEINVEKTDRVLFYFAGHGFPEEAQDSQDGQPAGYFMPQNVEDSNKETWLSMQKLHKVFTDLNCHHLLMILDCCFAGRISWVGSGRNAARSRKLYQQSYDRFIKYPTQQIITSAAHDEEAQDVSRFAQRGEKNGHSPFAHFLLKMLKGDSDGGKDKYIAAIFDKRVITVQGIFTYLQEQLAEEKAEQTPGLLQSRTEQDGQYVLLKGEYIFPLVGFNREDLEEIKLDEDTNPYKGLNAYEAKDKDLFYGRTRLIDGSKDPKEPKEGLFSKVSKHALTLVLGVSGSGKSSLVKAGLIPAIKIAGETGQQKWIILEPMRPGEFPFDALNQLLTPPGSNYSGFTSLDNQKKCEIIYSNIGKKFSLNTKLLLVIDQAEELFTLCQNPQDCSEFIKLLDKLLTDHEHLRIVLTLRSEFEPKFKNALKETRRQQIWQEVRFFVTPMNREELQQAIEEPAAQKALFFESPQLVNALIDEVIQMPGALPLLSLTLSQLYLKYLNAEGKQDRHDRTITWADVYDGKLGIGGVLLSLTQTADETYNKLVKENVDASTIRDVMLRMVVRSSGGELARRRVLKSELDYPNKEKNDQVDKIIKYFYESRLLIKQPDTENKEWVEPAHDALITGWGKVRDWLDEKQEIVQKGSGSNPIKKFLAVSKVLQLLKSLFPVFLTSKENGNKSDLTEAEKHTKVNLSLQQEVTTAGLKWEANKKETKYLWNASPYLNVLKLVLKSEQNNNWLNKLESEFVQRSLNQREKNRRFIIGFVFTAFSIVSVFSLIQWKQNQEAQSINLAESAKTMFKSAKQLEASIQAIKAGKKLKWVIFPDAVATHQAVAALHEAVFDSYEFNRLKVESNQECEHRMMSVSNNRDIQQKVEEFKLEFKSKKHNCALLILNSTNASDKWTIAGFDDKNEFKEYLIHYPSDELSVALKKKTNLGEIVELVTSKLGLTSDVNANVISTQFGSDGNILISLSENGIVKLLSLDGKIIKTLQNNLVSDEIYKSNNPTRFSEEPIFKISPDGKMLALLSGGNIHLLNLDSEKVTTLPSNKLNISDISFSPDSEWLALKIDEGGIQLWNLDNNKVKVIHSNISNIEQMSFSQNGKILALAGDKNFIEFWNPDRPDAKPRIFRDQSFTEALKFIFSPDLKFLALVDKESQIQLWNIQTGKKINKKTNQNDEDLNQSDSREPTPVFSQDGKMLATFSFDGILEVWDTETSKILWSIEASNDGSHGSNAKQIMFSPVGKTLLTMEQSGLIKLWNAEGNNIPRELPVGLKSISNLAFSPKNHMLALAGEKKLSKPVKKEKFIELWDLNSKNNPMEISGEHSEISSISFSPDGKLLALAGEKLEKTDVNKQNNQLIELWSLESEIPKKIENTLSHPGVFSVSF